MSAAVTAFLAKMPTAVGTPDSPDDLVVEFGYDAFVLTELTKEVNTNLSECLFAMIFPKDTPTITNDANDDFLSCDGVIESSAITAARIDDGTSGLDFWYIFIGKV